MLRISQPDRLAGQRGTWWGADPDPMGWERKKSPMVETSGIGYLCGIETGGTLAICVTGTFSLRCLLYYLGAVQIKA